MKKRDFVVQECWYVPLPGMSVEQQFDGIGHHRLVLHGHEGTVTSEWAGYEFFASLGDLRGCTDYWSGQFPLVFKVIPPVGHRADGSKL